jgi:hypothetical protein
MGKYYVLVLASDMKRIGFMSLFERNFVLRWVMSIGAAEEIARIDHFDFALVNFDPDPDRAIRFCETLKKIQPRMQIIFLKSAGVELPENFCADLVLDGDISEQELASHLQSYVRRSA